MIQQDLLKDTVECPVCHGTGDLLNHERDSWPCETCNTSGELSKEQLDEYLKAN